MHGPSRRFLSGHALPDTGLFRQLIQHTKNPASVAVVDSGGQIHSYRDVMNQALHLKKILGKDGDLSQDHVAFLLPNSSAYVATQWGIWAAGGVAVPLCTSHPVGELEYILKDSEAKSIILGEGDTKQEGIFAERIKPLAKQLDIPIHTLPPHPTSLSTDQLSMIPFDTERGAMMIYTSGTTGRPKGVLSTHKAVQHQTESLVKAWGWTSKDRILHTLPLHHVHGVINAMVCAHYAGATVEFGPERFDAAWMWKRWRGQTGTTDPITLFTGVPTMYNRLVDQANKEGMSPEQGREATRQIRLMMSGSSPLTTVLRSQWKELTSHTLLERYGMTETGMITGGSYEDPSKRVQGCVGWPFPGVEVRLDEGTGEVQVRGPSLFKEYWRKEEATKASFTQHGWFRTGDTGTWDEQGGLRLLGRSSVDIIKTRGYKVSALEVEGAIMSQVPGIRECAVIGVEDEAWGQKVMAILVQEEGSSHPRLEAKEIRHQLKDTLAPYKLPSQIQYLSSLPRNQMGKVNKKGLIKDYVY
ncbi:MAG: hypothetical protein DHS80DRAFT_32937 [Piptocephalis tieghemiana]|nr:MAG: hypothetical protein DHS80DRAFT_32937 [Piptocephalis tieghemiana]